MSNVPVQRELPSETRKVLEDFWRSGGRTARQESKESTLDETLDQPVYISVRENISVRADESENPARMLYPITFRLTNTDKEQPYTELRNISARPSRLDITGLLNELGYTGGIAGVSISDRKPPVVPQGCSLFETTVGSLIRYAR